MPKRPKAHSDGASDEALLASVALGDEQAAVKFIRRYQRRVYGLAFAMVHDSGLAEDIAQEAFIRAWRHAQIFDARRATVSTWMLMITRNLAIDALRVRRMVPSDPDDVVFVGLTSAARQPEDAAFASESTYRLQVALKALPVDQRRAVVLAGMYGRTAAEIAVSESIPLGTAKSRIRSGISKLRDALVAEEVL